MLQVQATKSLGVKCTQVTKTWVSKDSDVKTSAYQKFGFQWLGRKKLWLSIVPSCQNFGCQKRGCQLNPKIKSLGVKSLGFDGLGVKTLDVNCTQL